MAHYVIILAAGNGSRVKKSAIPKQFLKLNNLPIVMHSMNAFANYKTNTKCYIGLPANYTKIWSELCIKHKFNINHCIFEGGNERANTVFKGLECIKKQNKINDSDIVFIHDAARPFISQKLISIVLESTKQNNSAIPVIKLKNALKKSHSHRDRGEYRIAQTPQCFRFNEIFNAYTHIINSKMTNMNLYQDDAHIYESFNKKPNLVNGEEHNIKITTDQDYFISEKLYEFYKKFND